MKKTASMCMSWDMNAQEICKKRQKNSYISLMQYKFRSSNGFISHLKFNLAHLRRLTAPTFWGSKMRKIQFLEKQINLLRK